MRKVLFFLFIVSGLITSAQLPSVDIYYSNLNVVDGKWAISNLKNITNRIGYDNQPSFSADGKTIYYTAIYDTIQADIYTYNITSGTTTQLTSTIESEYSPVIMENGKGFSVVRVEQDSTQRMWVFKMDGNKPKLLLEKIDSMGYYCAVDEQHYAFFIVTDTPTLILADIKKQTSKLIDNNIGRCIKMIPGEKAFSYIVKNAESNYIIKRFDLTTQTTSVITNIPAVSEDFVWTINGEILMPRDNQIWMYPYKKENAQWSRILTIKDLKGKKIYRMALTADGNGFAFVGDE